MPCLISHTTLSRTQPAFIRHGSCRAVQSSESFVEQDRTCTVVPQGTDQAPAIYSSRHLRNLKCFKRASGWDWWRDKFLWLAGPKIDVGRWCLRVTQEGNRMAGAEKHLMY